YEYAEEQELKALRERVRRANSNVQTRLIVKKAPDPGAEICRTSQREGADLLVVSTHARHHVAHLLIGSTTMRVISDPPAPALAGSVNGGREIGTVKRDVIRRIGVPVMIVPPALPSGG